MLFSTHTSRHRIPRFSRWFFRFALETKVTKHARPLLFARLPVSLSFRSQKFSPSSRVTAAEKEICLFATLQYAFLGGGVRRGCFCGSLNSVRITLVVRSGTGTTKGCLLERGRNMPSRGSCRRNVRSLLLTPYLSLEDASLRSKERKEKDGGCVKILTSRCACFDARICALRRVSFSRKERR